jgi:hypothetical protein
MGGEGNGSPGFRLGQVKQNPMFRQNIQEMDFRRSACGQGVPSCSTGLVIQPSSGIACAQNNQRIVLKRKMTQGKDIILNPAVE